MRSAILMYHSVTRGLPDDPYGVSQEAFSGQISWLLDHGYEFSSLLSLLQSGGEHTLDRKRKQVVLTFDDGYRDFFINALPLLISHRLPATVFLVTNMMGQTASWNRYSPDLPLMTESEVQEVKSQGISLGSHTRTHPDLTVLGDDDLHRQLVMSRKTLTDFGETFHSFSYPWGKHTDREVAAVREADYECAVTGEGALHFSRNDPYRLGRLTMRRDLDIRSFNKMLAGPTWPRWIAGRARALVRRVSETVLPST